MRAKLLAFSVFSTLLIGSYVDAQGRINPLQEIHVKTKESVFDLFDHVNSQRIDPTFLNKNDQINDFNPLGPKAQILREISYQLKSPDLATDKSGLWIRFESVEYLYKNRRINIVTNENDLIKVDIGQCKKSLRQAIKALVKLEIESAYAKNIIQTLQNSENKFVISIVSISESYMVLPLPNNKLGFLNNNAYAFQVLEKESLMVEYAPFDQIGSGAEIRWTHRLGIMSLAHELAHAYDANYGLLDDRLMYAYKEVMSAREIRALYHENMIRYEMEKKLRIDAYTGRAYVSEGIPYTYPLPISARY